MFFGGRETMVTHFSVYREITSVSYFNKLLITHTHLFTTLYLLSLKMNMEAQMVLKIIQIITYMLNLKAD